MRASRIRTVAVAVVAFVLAAAPAFAQSATPSATPSLLPNPTASHSWTYYMAIATIGIAGVTLIAVVLGYLVQAPGFRKSERPTRPGQAA